MQQLFVPPYNLQKACTYNAQHWHGLSQRSAIFSDGSPSASQWPIPPLHFFDYEVHPEKDDAGTYFYHSHVGFQMGTASGPLIVDDAEDSPYHYGKF
jgi:L-ascorbate oxidase